MTQLHPVTVRILDKDYNVGCPAAERANLESAARYLDGKMREIRETGKVFGIERIAVLAALNISYEMLQAQQGGSGTEHAPREQASDLLERIDRALHGDDPALRRQQRQAQAGQLHSPQVQAPTPVPPQPQQPYQPQPPHLQQEPQFQQSAVVEQPRPSAPWEQVPPPAADVWNPPPETPQGNWDNPAPLQDWSATSESFQPALEPNAWQPVVEPPAPPVEQWQQPAVSGWQQGEDSPQGGSGFPDGGPDFQLPPQQR